MRFVLEQNYPNPFNPSTTISYSIPERELVTLGIYDSLGEMVSEIVNEEKEAGTYKLNYIATDLTSGIYFLRLNCGKFQETKKMILLK